MSIYIDGYTSHCLHFDGSDDSTTIIDVPQYSGWAGNWTCAGTAKLDTAQYKFGTASLLLDGDSDYVERYGGEPGDNVNGVDFTVDMWVRFNSTSGLQTLVSRHNTTDGWRLWWDGSNNRFEFENKTSSSVDITGTFAATISTGQWYHIAFVRYGDDHMLFVNGVQAGSTLTDASTITDSSGKLRIGATVTPNNYFNGWIDEFHFSSGIARWTTGFTPESSAYGYGTYDENTLFLAHYNGKSGSGNVGTYCGVRASVGDVNFSQNTTSGSYCRTTQKKFGVTSLFMNNSSYPQLRYELGSSDIDLNITDWTIEFQLRIVSAVGGDSWDIIGRWPNSGTNDGWAIDISNGTSLRFTNRDAGSNTINFSRTHGMSADTWYHVALVKNGNDYKFFVDGTQIGSTETDDSTIKTASTSPRLYIGKKATWNSSGPDYYIDEVRISNVARWTSNFTAPTAEYSPPQIYDESISDSFGVGESVIGNADQSVSVAESFDLDDEVSFSPEATVSESFILGDAVSGDVDPVYEEAADEWFMMDDSAEGDELPYDSIADSFALGDMADVELTYFFGDIKLTLAPFTVEGSGDSPWNMVGITLPVLTMEASSVTGVMVSTGDDVSLPVPTAVGYTGAQGEANLWSAYSVTLDASSTDSPICSAEITLPGFTTNLSGTTEYVGSLSQTLPRFRSAAEMQDEILANLAKPLPKLSVSGHAYSGEKADVNLTIDGWRLEATGHIVGSAELSATLPGFYLVATSRGGVAGYTQVPVMNTRNASVSEWNIAFNSLAFFNNKMIATDGSKIYEITGTTDDIVGTDDEITCNVKTGNLDLANFRTMRFTDAYMNVKANGDLLMQFELDEGSTYNFEVTMHDLVDVHEEKVNLGKGMKARSYAVSLYNVDGSAFVLHRLQLIGDLLD